MIINIVLQRDLRLPSTMFSEDPYGEAITAASFSALISVRDLSAARVVCTDKEVILTRIGDQMITRGREWFSLPFDDIEADPTGAPAGIGPMVPGHHYAVTFNPLITGDITDFVPVNIKFGITDHRVQAVQTPSDGWNPMWAGFSGDMNLSATWINSDWILRRIYANDARWASSVHMVDVNGNILDMKHGGAGGPSNFEYQNGDPSQIHYCGLIGHELCFDGQQLYTTGFAGVLDGTPWYEAVGDGLVGILNLFDLNNGMRIEITHEQYDLALTQRSTWWTTISPWRDSRYSPPLIEAIASQFRAPAIFSEELHHQDGSGTSLGGYTCDGPIEVTQDLDGFQLLSYRHVWINGELWKEYGTMNAPASWYGTDDATDNGTYLVARRKLYDNEGEDPTTYAINYWNPTGVSYGELELV